MPRTLSTSRVHASPPRVAALALATLIACAVTASGSSVLPDPQGSLPPGFTLDDMVKGASAPGVFTGDGAASQSGMPPYPALPGWPIVNILGGASPPVAADLDPGYPGLEVAVGTLSSGNNLYVFHADGTTMAGWPRGIGFFVASSPSIGDLDDDGDLEVVALLPVEQRSEDVG